MHTPVVSNTSPIWNLASIERLDLLHDQFSIIRIPQDVWSELQVGRSPSALKNHRVVFNIGGNKYRLVVKFNFLAQTVYTRFLVRIKNMTQ